MLVRYRLCMGITAVAVLLAISGCGKKDEPETQTSSYSDMPQLESSAPTKDSAEIFDEFYDGESEESYSNNSVEETTESTDSYSSSAASDYTPDFAPDGRYVVQVSTVASRAVGEDVAQKFENMGYPAYLAEVQNPTADLMGTYYRVRIGSFNSISSANQFGNNALVPKGYDFWVDYRSNDNIGMSGYGLGESSTSDYQDSYESESSYGSSSYESESSYGSDAGHSGTSDASTDNNVTSQDAATDEWGDGESSSSVQQEVEQSTTPQTEDVSTPPQTQDTAPASEGTTESAPANNSATSEDWSDDEWNDDDWSSESSW